MSRAAGTIGAAVAALVLAAAGSAAAGKGDVRAATSIAIEGQTNTADDAVLIGSIDSKKPRCLDNRKVRVTLIPQNGPNFAFDVARTGGGGGWFALHDLDEVNAISPIDLIRVRVTKRKIRLSGDRRLICGGARLGTPPT